MRISVTCAISDHRLCNHPYCQCECHMIRDKRHTRPENDKKRDVKQKKSDTP